MMHVGHAFGHIIKTNLKLLVLNFDRVMSDKIVITLFNGMRK